jgi:hypothetical protein
MQLQIPLCVLSHFTNKAPIMSFVRRTYLYSKYFTLSARDPPCVCSGRERPTSLAKF